MSVQIDQACDISRFADVESVGRYALRGVHWDEDRKLFAATDSRVLAIVPPPASDEPQSLGESAVIPSKMFQRMGLVLKGVKESWNAVVSLVSGKARLRIEQSTTFTEAECCPVEGRFPRYIEVLPPRSAYDREYRIDPIYLKYIADYFVEHRNEADGMFIKMRVGNDPRMSLEFSGVVTDELRRVYVILMPADNEGKQDHSLSEEPTASETYPAEQPAEAKPKRKKPAKKK